MGLRGKILVGGAAGIFTLAGLNLGVWTFSTASVDNNSQVRITPSENALIATEFYGEDEQSGKSDCESNEYFFKVTNKMNSPIEIIVDFEKQGNKCNSPDLTSDNADESKGKLPIQETAQFDKMSKDKLNGNGTDKKVDRDNGRGIEIIDADPVTIMPGESVELPVKITGWDKNNNYSFGIEANVTAKWANGEAVIIDQLIIEDKDNEQQGKNVQDKDEEQQGKNEQDKDEEQQGKNEQDSDNRQQGKDKQGNDNQKGEDKGGNKES